MRIIIIQMLIWRVSMKVWLNVTSRILRRMVKKPVELNGKMVSYYLNTDSQLKQNGSMLHLA